MLVLAFLEAIDGTAAGNIGDGAVGFHLGIVLAHFLQAGSGLTPAEEVLETLAFAAELETLLGLDGLKVDGSEGGKLGASADAVDILEGSRKYYEKQYLAKHRSVYS